MFLDLLSNILCHENSMQKTSMFILQNFPVFYEQCDFLIKKNKFFKSILWKEDYMLGREVIC